MVVIAAAVKLILCENKLRHYFQEVIIAYSLRVCTVFWKSMSPKKRYIALCIVHINHG